MKNLWFKNEFVLPILDGHKSHTIRKSDARLPKVGEIVSFSVGPRPPFAKARVLKVRMVKLSELEPAQRTAVLRCYKNTTDLVRVEFTLINEDLFLCQK